MGRKGKRKKWTWGWSWTGRRRRPCRRWCRGPGRPPPGARTTAPFSAASRTEDRPIKDHWKKVFVCLFVNYSKVKKEMAGWGRYAFVSLNLKTILTGQGDIRKLQVLPKCFNLSLIRIKKKHCNVCQLFSLQNSFCKSFSHSLDFYITFVNFNLLTILRGKFDICQLWVFLRCSSLGNTENP